MGDRRWFKARASGLGWSPAGWRGWLVTAAGAAVLAAANVLIALQLCGSLR